MKAQQRGRRRFLKQGVTAAGLTAGAIWSARGQTSAPTVESTASELGPKGFRAYGERSPYEHTMRSMPPEVPGFTPLQEFAGITNEGAMGRGHLSHPGKMQT